MVFNLLRVMSGGVSRRYISVISDRDARPLVYLLRSGDYDRAQSLIDDGEVDINEYSEWTNTPIINSIKHNDIESVKFLLHNNADIYSGTRYCSRRPLHYAVDYSRDEIIKLIIDDLRDRSDINMLDSKMNTPLDLAHNDRIREILVMNGGRCGSELNDDEIDLMRCCKN